MISNVWGGVTARLCFWSLPTCAQTHSLAPPRPRNCDWYILERRPLHPSVFVCGEQHCQEFRADPSAGERYAPVSFLIQFNTQLVYWNVWEYSLLSVPHNAKTMKNEEIHFYNSHICATFYLKRLSFHLPSIKKNAWKGKIQCLKWIYSIYLYQFKGHVWDVCEALLLHLLVF